jgi:hypothetical protein
VNTKQDRTNWKELNKNKAVRLSKECGGLLTAACWMIEEGVQLDIR